MSKALCGNKGKGRLFCIYYAIDIENVIFLSYLLLEKRNALVKTNQEFEDAIKALETTKQVLNKNITSISSSILIDQV